MALFYPHVLSLCPLSTLTLRLTDRHLLHCETDGFKKIYLDTGCEGGIEEWNERTIVGEKEILRDRERKREILRDREREKYSERCLNPLI
jgi:hypothetical protein